MSQANALEQAILLKLCHQSVTGSSLDGRTLHMQGREHLNFSNCSYLGLELDKRLVHAAVEATFRYGVQFSCSRAYLSLGLYEELEQRLSRIFDAHALATPTTTLGHMSAIPVLVGPKDAIVLDERVHHSVQMATAVAKAAGAHVEVVRHNNMDRLAERVADLSNHHDKVWYACDGVYSIFGDFAPIEVLKRLRAQFASLHLYIDDAHGMSWTGSRGCGSVREQLESLERVVIAASLSKSFGAGGGVLVFPDRELLRQVRIQGGPPTFSGPIQPPILAAAVASADIHLGEGLAELQAELAERVSQFQALADAAGLPVVSNNVTPIRFIGIGDRETMFDIAARLLGRGIYVNASTAPAVSLNQSGLRLVITRHHRPQDLQQLVDALAEEVPAGMKRHSLDASCMRDRFAQALVGQRGAARAASLRASRRCAPGSRQAASALS